MADQVIRAEKLLQNNGAACGDEYLLTKFLSEGELLNLEKIYSEWVICFIK